MHRQTSLVEWVVAESDEEWEQLYAAACPENLASSAPAPPNRRSIQRIVAGITILLLLVGAGAWWWRMTLAVSQRQAAAVSATAVQEITAVAESETRLTVTSAGDQSGLDGWYRRGGGLNGLSAAVQTADPTAHPNVDIDVSQLQEEGSLARVVVTARNGEVTKRQTRFYRRTATGWELTTPDPEFWGPTRRLETPSFIFHFRESDAAAIIALAPEVEDLYQTMRRNFGLESTPGAQKLMIEVSVTHYPGRKWPASDRSYHITVASPTLYPARVKLSDTEILAQSLAIPLLERVMAQARERQTTRSAWQPVLSALRLWQFWDLDLPLSAWRADVVRWLYADLHSDQRRQAEALLARYRELCAVHLLWMHSPLQIHLPFSCSQQDQTRWRLYWQTSKIPLTSLAQLMAPAEPEVSQVREFSLLSQPDQTIALVTLIDFAVVTYGRDRLPVLIKGMGQHDSWDTLLPAVYGVSPTEFEAGWQAYLAALLEPSRDTSWEQPMMQGRPW